MVTLTNSTKVSLKNSDTYIKEPQACGLNSILAILVHLNCATKINIEHIKEIFDYDEDGIRDERYRFNKLNKYLNDKQVPYRFYPSKYESLSDLYKHLNNNLPVPVFFWLKILNFTHKHYKTEYQMNLGDIFQSDNKHVLILVGYENKGEKIFFIDPSYQMPWVPQSDTDLSKHYFAVDAKDFYECTRYLKTFIEVKYLKTEAKRYSKTKPQKEKQAKLA